MLSYLVYAWRYLVWAVGDLLRRRGRAPDYVTLILAGNYPELPAAPEPFVLRWLRPAPPSLAELARQFRALAHDTRVRGVVLYLRGLDLPLARLDTLRGLLGELRAAGKRVVVWSYGYDTADYYLACAADDILLIPGGVVGPLGVAQRYLFLGEALDRAGVRAEFLPISPYKTAADQLTRRDLSAEAREMAEWLLDETYTGLVEAIATGRRITTDAVRALIDRTPATDPRAVELGLVDAVLNEEELPTYLGSEERPARLVPWEEARLRRLPPLRPGRHVALLTIEGTIVHGYNQRPPIEPPFDIPLATDKRAGDLSVVQAARRALADRRAAAVVVYIDSRGGDATASEAMRAALARLAAQKPLIVAMGNVAASGGYWVATPAREIIAQPNTITGSIGVLLGKVYDAGLLGRLLLHRETLYRGEHALAFGADRPFTEAERTLAWESVNHIYSMFLDRVSEARRMSREAVDAVGGGRVWTGRQALSRGLVDELGGLQRAVVRARELGGLDPRAPVRIIGVGGGRAARLEPSTLAGLRYALEGLALLNGPMLLC